MTSCAIAAKPLPCAAVDLHICREWFHPVKSELQAVSLELAVERRLRRVTEEKLRRAEDARRAAERERDLFRVSADMCSCACRAACVCCV